MEHKKSILDMADEMGLLDKNMKINKEGKRIIRGAGKWYYVSDDGKIGEEAIE